MPFTIGTDVLIQNASAIDAATLDPGGPNEQVDFTLMLDPQATFSNDTDLEFDIGYHFGAMLLSGSYSLVLASGGIGPIGAYETSADLPIGSVGVYDGTFDLNFAPENITFFA